MYNFARGTLQNASRAFIFKIRKELRTMNEEEIKAKAEELERKEGELAKKEEELNAKEQTLASRETDAAKIAETLKKEFEARIEAQKKEFEERLQQRDEVIKQLASDESKIDDDGPFAQLNKKRLAQRAA